MKASRKRNLLFVMIPIGLIGSFTLGYTSRGSISLIKGKINNYLRSDNLSKLDYNQVQCPAKSLAIALFGQSNSANTVIPKSNIVIPENLYQYDWKTRKCFKYKEPLLGASDANGNAITYTAVEIANNTSVPVLIIPFGIGGTSVLRWAYRDLSHLHEIVLDHMKKDAIYPKIFFWHQGESDAKWDNDSRQDLINTPNFESPRVLDLGLSKNAYALALQKIVDKTLEFFPETKFGIALATRCFGPSAGRSNWYPVRQAQEHIAKVNNSAFISADTDKLKEEKFRHDRCHFSEVGAKELGKQYYKSFLKVTSF